MVLLISSDERFPVVGQEMQESLCNIKQVKPVAAGGEINWPRVFVIKHVIALMKIGMDDSPMLRR
ncbi:hypothetical protein D3C81_2251470 [compost metagenome]